MQTYTAKSGLVFDLLRQEPYTRKGGGDTVVDVWGATCRRDGCLSRFEVRTPHRADTGTSNSFGRVHCDAHKATRQEATDSWVAACTKANTKLTPATLKTIKAAYKAGLPPADIALLVPIGQSRIYTIIRKHKITR
jgi:hypothetical protein